MASTDSAPRMTSAGSTDSVWSALAIAFAASSEPPAVALASAIAAARRSRRLFPAVDITGELLCVQPLGTADAGWRGVSPGGLDVTVRPMRRSQLLRLRDGSKFVKGSKAKIKSLNTQRLFSSKSDKQYEADRPRSAMPGRGAAAPEVPGGRVERAAHDEAGPERAPRPRRRVPSVRAAAGGRPVVQSVLTVRCRAGGSGCPAGPRPCRTRRCRSPSRPRRRSRRPG